MAAQSLDASLPSAARDFAAASTVARRIVFNGRFLAGASTGVQRVAAELILAFDGLLAARPDLRARYAVELYSPRNLARTLDLQVISIRKGGWFGGVPWEQFDLPRRRRGGAIVSFCNLGPIIATDAITMIHDAQVHDTPESYSAAFRLWYKMIQPLIGARHKRVLTVSNYSMRQIATAGIAPASKISVVYNGVDHVLRATPAPDVLSRLDLPSHNYVLGLANLQAHKNLRILLEAFTDDRLRSLRLVLFGGADRAAIERLIEGPLPPNVVLAGKVSDGELRSLMEAALCLCFPSTTEGFGLPPLEALALGCPAVCAPCGALPEVCGDSVLYADPSCADKWSEAILRLRDDPVFRFAQIEAGKAHAARFTWSAAAEQLLAILDEVGSGDVSTKFGA